MEQRLQLPPPIQKLTIISVTMDHVAIMKPSWKLLPKILSGEKIIESRWYKHRYTPWDKVSSGDNIYFKDSGQPITIVATVSHVLQFDHLTPNKVKNILNTHGQEDGIEKHRFPYFLELFKDKKYCILIFLKDIQLITPFHIDKTGFGTMSAWISIEDIAKIRIEKNK